MPGPGRARRDPPPRLRALARRPGRQRRRGQRLRAARLSDAPWTVPAASRSRAPASATSWSRPRCTRTSRARTRRARPPSAGTCCGSARSPSTRRDPSSSHGDGAPRRGRLAQPAAPLRPATPGAWRSTSTPAPAATPASSPARRRTTSRWSARSRWRWGARCTGSASTATSRATSTHPAAYHQPVICHALRAGAVRGGLPGGGHGALGRRPQRHGLQPLRRDALLLEQLPLQGAALQLPALEQAGAQRRAPSPVLELLRNPDVTVRFRGVMEKCTYCVQRINAAKIDERAREPQGARRRDPHRLPAGLPHRRRSSSATSTTPGTQVSKWKAEPRNYGILTELNTRPRTTYLARVRNPNPELGSRRPRGGGARMSALGPDPSPRQESRSRDDRA